jgi:hypothetical protein
MGRGGLESAGAGVTEVLRLFANLCALVFVCFV